jgi:hypothetical protein
MRLIENKFFALCASMVAAISFYSCSPAAPKLSPEQKFKEVEKVSSENKNVFRRPKIDILFVVDNSGSMDTHQTKLKNNIALFVDEFRKLKIIDYHIGVISTDDSDNGHLQGTPKYIDNKTVNGLDLLKNNIMLGTDGNYIEKEFEPLQMALDPFNYFNAGFYRAEAYLIPIFLTDEPEQSDNISPQDMMDYLVNLKGTMNKILPFAALENSSDIQCRIGSDQKKIEEFMALAINAGNNIVSLCDPVYGKKLVDFSKSIVSAVNKPIILDRKPAQASIKVYFGTQLIPSDLVTGWFFDPKENSIKFGEELILDESQPEDASIEVQFDAAAFSQ